MARSSHRAKFQFLGNRESANTNPAILAFWLCVVCCVCITLLFYGSRCLACHLWVVYGMKLAYIRVRISYGRLAAGGCSRTTAVHTYCSCTVYTRFSFLPRWLIWALFLSSSRFLSLLHYTWYIIVLLYRHLPMGSIHISLMQALKRGKVLLGKTRWRWKSTSREKEVRVHIYQSSAHLSIVFCRSMYDT